MIAISAKAEYELQARTSRGIYSPLATSFMKTRILIFLICIFAISCRQNNDFKYSELHGYFIGDSLTSDFEITRSYGPYFNTAKHVNDSLFEVSTVSRHITHFHISVTENKYKETIRRYKLLLGEPIQHYIGDTIHTVKLNHQIEHYTWIDKLNYTKYEVFQSLDSIKNGFITISNDSITESLYNKFIPNYNEVEEEIEIEIVEENQ